MQPQGCFSLLPFRAGTHKRTVSIPAGPRTTFAPISIAPRARLRCDHTLARQAEPRLHVVAPELGGAQLDDLQWGLDCQDDLACRAARGTDLTRRTFSVADEAQPQSARFQCGSHALDEARALLGFIEDMKTTAVEDEVERAIGQRRGEKVQCRKATGQPSLFHFAVRPLDRERRDIDSKDIETALGNPN
jgi:hypothetical protein